MFENFYLKIELIGDVKAPTRGTSESAGLDFYVPEDLRIFPGKDALVPLNVRIEMPEGYAMIFKEKSGLSTKFKLSIGACVVDSDYRGIVHAHIFNHGQYWATFNKGDKLIQAIIVPIWTGIPEIGIVNMETVRGEGGFGSTGR
jgi:deoxyuridine 5'-triphosphate nucleotidohydrolase